MWWSHGVRYCLQPIPGKWRESYALYGCKLSRHWGGWWWRKRSPPSDGERECFHAAQIPECITPSPVQAPLRVGEKSRARKVSDGWNRGETFLSHWVLLSLKQQVLTHLGCHVHLTFFPVLPAVPCNTKDKCQVAAALPVHINTSVFYFYCIMKLSQIMAPNCPRLCGTVPGFCWNSGKVPQNLSQIMSPNHPNFMKEKKNESGK